MTGKWLSSSEASAFRRLRTNSGDTERSRGGSSSSGRKSCQLRKNLKKKREAPPKPIPKTIDNQRACDETTGDPKGEGVAYDEATDAPASYLNRQTSPKVLITTSDGPHGRTVRRCEQLSTVTPNSRVCCRTGLALKKHYSTVHLKRFHRSDDY